MGLIDFDVADDKESPSMPRTRGTTPKIPKVANEGPAAQATEILLQLNAAACAGLFLCGMTETSSAIASRETAFKEQVYQALLGDPKLCRTILRLQGTGGIISLLIAYSMLGVSVAPTAIAEVRQKKGTGELGISRMFAAFESVFSRPAGQESE